jgi:hypothetical protein
MAAKRRKQRKAHKSHSIYGFAHTFGRRPNRTTILEMSDGEIFAIGMLTVQWAFLEHMLLLETARLANRAKFAQLPSDATSLSFSRRLAAWRIMLRDTVKTKRTREHLLRLTSRIAMLEDRRHKITHGLWEWYPSNPDRLHVYSYRPGIGFSDPTLSCKKIIEIAESVAAASYELSHANPNPSGNQIARVQLQAFREHGYAYWSRRALLTMTGRDHADLVPLSTTLRSRTPLPLASLGSPPRAECRVRGALRRSTTPRQSACLSHGRKHSTASMRLHGERRSKSA